MMITQVGEYLTHSAGQREVYPFDFVQIGDIDEIDWVAFNQSEEDSELRRVQDPIDQYDVNENGVLSHSEELNAIIGIGNAWEISRQKILDLYVVDNDGRLILWRMMQIGRVVD